MLTSFTKNVQRYARPTERLILFFLPVRVSRYCECQKLACISLECSALERTRPSSCSNGDSTNLLQVHRVSGKIVIIHFWAKSFQWIACLQPELKRRRKNTSKADDSDGDFEMEMDTADSDHESDCDGEEADEFPMGFQEMWENAVEERPGQQKKHSRPPLPPRPPTVRSVSVEKMDADSWTSLQPSAHTRLPLPPPSPAIADVPVYVVRLDVLAVLKFNCHSK